MDAVFTLGESSVSDVRASLENPPSYSAVRATMGILVDKGWLAFKKTGKQYLYKPAISRRTARRSALRRVLDTFFEGSTDGAIAALLDLRGRRLKDEELERIARLVEKARLENRGATRPEKGS